MKQKIRIGTRGSQLALYQAELVKSKIQNDFPLVTIEIVKIKTSGDMVRRGAFHPLENKRMFTREIEESLRRGEIDLAVHSAKDTSVVFPEGLKIGAVIEREDPRDCLISQETLKLAGLPIGARIGTSSVRRKKQLQRWNPDLVIEDVRGNVETRIRKVEEGNYDAVVLAYAGIKRLGLEHRVSDILPENPFYPAPGQGTILVQSRSDDAELDEVLRPLNHEESEQRLLCERAFLKRLEGGCQLPCGLFTVLEGLVLRAGGALYALEGSACAEASTEGAAEDPEKVGRALAERVLANDGQKILDEIRNQYDQES